MENQAANSKPYAGFWLRLIAFIVDGAILSAVYLPISVASSALVYPLLAPAVPLLHDTGPSSYRSAIENQISIARSVSLLGLLYGLVLILALGYFVVLTSRKGGTPGKLLLHLKVVDGSGNKISLGTSLLRHTIGYLVSSFTGLGFLWIAIDGRKQGWHDKIAQTFVIREHRAGQSETRFSLQNTASGFLNRSADSNGSRLSA